MPISLVRVDDRLIHGQVVAVWLRALPADRIVVIDDATAADSFLREVLVLAAPPGVPVEVLGLADGAGRARELTRGSERAYLLLRNPGTALTLRREGVEFEALNVGGLGMRPGRRSIHRTIAASPEELDAMRQLEELGTRVELRIVPDDRPVAFRSISNRP